MLSKISCGRSLIIPLLEKSKSIYLYPYPKGATKLLVTMKFVQQLVLMFVAIAVCVWGQDTCSIKYVESEVQADVTRAFTNGNNCTVNGCVIDYVNFPFNKALEETCSTGKCSVCSRNVLVIQAIRVISAPI
jgi:hypothetical protein